MEAMGESDDVGTRTSEVFEGPSSERVMALLLFQADLKVGPLPTTNYRLPTTDYRLPTTRKEDPVFPAMHNRWVTFDCYGTLVSRSSFAAVRPFDDVEPMLAELRLRGYRLGVLTNCDDARFETVHRRFRRPFDLFVTADRIRGFKPELWHFRGFQLLAQVNKRNWIHVSSDWRQDILPAQSFGIQRVWFDRDDVGEDPSRATAHVHTATEVLRAVDWLFQDRAVVCAS
jgi:FMN phosphatase YigB (HAD superfamily)